MKPKELKNGDDMSVVADFMKPEEKLARYHSCLCLSQITSGILMMKVAQDRQAENAASHLESAP